MSDDLGITPSQAHYVLSKLVSERKVARRDVAACLASMQSEIADLEEKLEELRALRLGGGRTAPAKRSRVRKRGAAPKVEAKAKKAAKGKTRSRITPQQRASRALQGTYMSLLRRIPKSKKSQYQTLAKEKNRQAAVDAMKAALGI